MRIKLQNITEQLHGFLLILLMAVLLCTNLFPDRGMYFFLHSLVLLIPYTISFFAVKYCKHLGTYLLLCALSCIAVYFLGIELFEQIYLAVLGIAIVLIRIPSRLHQTSGMFDVPSPGVLGVFAAAFFLAMFIKNPMMQTLTYWLTFGYLVNLLLWYNLKSLNGYLFSRKETANLPGHQIIATNRVMLLLFLSVLLLILLVFPLLPLDNLVTSIGIAIRDFLRWLFSHAPEGTQIIEETVQETASAAQSASPLLPAQDAPPAWLTMLYNILFFVIAGIVCTGIICGIGYAIYLLFRQFYRPVNTTGDEQEFIHETTDASFLEHPKISGPDSSLRFRFSANAVIRRQYIKTVKKELSRNHPKDRRRLDASFTPSQIEDYACGPSNSISPELHVRYEKARYSKDGCSRQDLSDR